MNVYSSDQEFLLRRGRVPAPRSLTIARERLLAKLYLKLCDVLANNKGQWIVVHGLVGSGKSQLVADLLWKHPEISLVDFKKILWLTDRNTNPERLADIAYDALVLLAAPVENDESILLDSSESRRRDIQSLLGEKLNKKLYELKSTHKVLFILDGVMNVQTIRFFEKFLTTNCYVIATSTNREIFATLDMVHVFHVPHGGDVALDGWHEMASNFNVDISRETLRSLVEASGYNFALMEKVFQLAQHNFEIIPSLLHRMSSRPLREISCTTHYHFAHLEESLRQCFEQVGQRLTACLAKCAPFDYNKPIYSELLKYLWPMDLCGQETELEINGMLEQDLHVLTQHSLLELYEDGSNNQYDETNYIKESGSQQISQQFSMIQENWRQYDVLSFKDNEATLSSETLNVSKSKCYWIQPMIFSFLVHSAPNSYKQFLNNINCMIVEFQKLTTRNKNAVPAKYLAENYARLQSLKDRINLHLKVEPKRRKHTKEMIKGDSNLTIINILFARLTASVLIPIQMIRYICNPIIKLILSS